MFFRKLPKIPEKGTLIWALEEILGRRKVRSILKGGSPAFAIERVARHLELDPQKLLQSVAGMLDLPPQREVVRPTEELLEACGFSSEELLSWKVLPQPAADGPAGYSLSIADPELVSIAEFQAQGVRVFLTLNSQIEKAWAEYEKRREHVSKPTSVPSNDRIEPHPHSLPVDESLFSEEEILPLLLNLAEECQSHGASNAKLMNGSRCSYEFYSNGSLYTGSLHPEFLKGLHSFLTPSPLLAFRTPSEEIELLVIQRDEEQIDGERSYRIHWEGRGARRPVSGRILLIDDDERFLFLLSTLLKNRKYEVLTSPGAREVLPHLINRTLVPDIILCDVHMPGMDGGGFLAALAQSGLRIPTLMLTSDDDRATEAEMALLGASVFLEKREDPRVLFAWVENLLRRGEHAHDA